MLHDRAGCLNSFNKWLRDPAQKITIHPDVEIRDEGRVAGYRVYAKANIAQDTIILQVPKAALLTPRTCGISNLLEETQMDAMTAVCLAYRYELSQGAESPWHAYLRVCPGRVEISKLWRKEDRRILRGSEVAMVGGCGTQDFKEIYNGDVRPFLKLHQEALGTFGQLTLEMFMDGMSVVGSRAFEIDAYHGLGMCPFADMLDHEVQENVHFQTTFDVCPECGELGGCEHDPESSDEEDEMSDTEGHAIQPHKNPAGSSHVHNQHCTHSDEDEIHEDDEDVCEMIVTRDIRAGDQVYNTYGDLGNDVLLARYGFALRNNTNDKLSLGTELLASPLKSHWAWFDLNGRNLMRALRDAEKESIGGADTFLKITESSDEDEGEEEADVEDALYLTSEGEPSDTLLHYLWINASPLRELEEMKAPGVLAHARELQAAWQYVQPGRMPLPPFASLQTITTIQSTLASLQVLLQARRRKYTVPYEELDHSSQEQHMQYAFIARESEEIIIRHCEAYLERIERACQWLLTRE